MDSFLKTDMGKMVIFMFLGLLFAIMVLGYHKSPRPSPDIPRQQYTNQPTRNPKETNAAIAARIGLQPSTTTNEFDQPIF